MKRLTAVSVALSCACSLGLLACGSAGAHAGGAPAPSPHDGDPSPPPVVLEEGVNFQVFRPDGTPATLDEVVAEARGVEAVLFGEEHTDRITHGLQEEFLRRAFVAYGRASARPAGEAPPGHPRSGTDREARRPIVLSLEMVERDVQYVLDEYLADLITEDHFLKSVRPWPRYETDYRPIVEFSKAHGIPVVAANAPRRYVERAGRLGRDSLDGLPETALAFLPPLPYPEPSPAYRAEWDELMGDAGDHLPGSPLDAQTLWDAAMGHSVATTIDAREGALVVHLAGGFHVENGTGIPEALEHYRPGTTALLIAARPSVDPSVLDDEFVGLGDFVILTQAPPEDESGGDRP